MTRLPPEIWLHIFQELNLQDIFRLEQTCKIFQSQIQDRYLWFTKAKKSRSRTPNSHHYRPCLTALSTSEMKRDAVYEMRVDSHWKADGFKPAYIKSFTRCHAIHNPIILPGGDFVLFSTASGRISMIRIENPRWEMALKEIATYQLGYSTPDFTLRSLPVRDGMVLAAIHHTVGAIIVELLRVEASPPSIYSIKTFKVEIAGEARVVATSAQENTFACLIVTASQQLYACVSAMHDHGGTNLLLRLPQQFNPYGHTMCMPSPETFIVCDGPTIWMYNIPHFDEPRSEKSWETMAIATVWGWEDEADPTRKIPLSPNIVFWNEAGPPTLFLISEYAKHTLTFEKLDRCSQLKLVTHHKESLQTEEVGDIELRRFISKGEKGLLCHEDSITPGQILRTISYDDPNFNTHYVRLYHQNFWSSGLEDYWIEDLDFDEVSGRMVFQCANPDEDEPYKFFIVDLV